MKWELTYTLYVKKQLCEGKRKITKSKNMQQHTPVKQSYMNISVANLTRQSYTKQHIIICNKL